MLYKLNLKLTQSLESLTTLKKRENIDGSAVNVTPSQYSFFKEDWAWAKEDKMKK